MKKMYLFLMIFTAFSFNNIVFAADSCSLNHDKAINAINEAIIYMQNHKEAYAKSGELLKKLRTKPNDPMAKEWLKEVQENNKITAPERLNPMPNIKAAFTSCKNNIKQRDALRQKLTEWTNKMSQATGIKMNVRFH